MTQFDFRAQSNVPGQQAEHGRTRHLLKSGNQFPDTRTCFAIQLMQQVLQPEHVNVEETLKITAGRRDAVPVETFADERGVRTPGEVQAFRHSWDFKFAGKGPLKCS